MTWNSDCCGLAGYVLGAVLSLGVEFGGRMRICFIRQQQGERVRVYDDAAMVGSREETWMPLGEQPCPIHTGSICGSMCVACMLLCLAIGNMHMQVCMSNPGLLIASKLVAAKMFKAPPRQTRKWPLCRALLFSPASGSRTISPCMYCSCRSADACGQRYLDVRGNNGDDTYCLWLLPMHYHSRVRWMKTALLSESLNDGRTSFSGRLPLKGGPAGGPGDVAV